MLVILSGDRRLPQREGVDERRSAGVPPANAAGGTPALPEQPIILTRFSLDADAECALA